MSAKAVEDESITWIQDLWHQERPLTETFLEFLEVPFDFAVSHRPGARFGPKAIINALNGFGATNIDRRQNLGKLRPFNGGRVEVNHDFSKAYSAIEDVAGRLPNNATMIAIGGDHSITDPLLRGVMKRMTGKKIGLVMIDAHMDCRPPVAGKEHSGHWVYTARDVISFDAMAQIGISSPLYSMSYVEALEREGMLLRTAKEVQADPQGTWEAISKQLRSVDCVYVTVDIDCIDQAFAPGTSVPAPQGLYPREVSDLLFRLASSFKIAGFDLTEVSPPLDHGDQTVQLAASLIHEFWAGLAAAQDKNIYG
jgi:agmatinase